MIRVPISAQMRAAAAAYEKTILALVAHRRNPNDGLEATGRYYYGRLMELAFEAMCRERGITARWLGNAEGRPDGGIDYQVDGRHAVQIKYTPHNGWRLMENAAGRSRQAAMADYYVAIQPNKQETAAHVRGYFTAAQVQAMPLDTVKAHQAPFHWARLSAASPIEELVDAWLPQGRML